MNDFGHFCLCLSWALSVIGLLCGVYAGVQNPKLKIETSPNNGVVTRWTASASAASVLSFLCVTLAFASLGCLFMQDDYSNQFVWQFSSRDMAWYYKVSAIWGGMDGSMLLWCLMLTLFSAVVAARWRSYPSSLAPWVLAVMHSSSLFFISVVVFLSNPFRYIKSTFIPPDGQSLNPLLQNPYMAIHPPTLYAGFTTLSIPFAFCIAALISGNLSNEWIRLTRRWTLIAWALLTCGIVLGGHWAYIELGWGGFWAWDPVENASFLPWLTATAFIHSIMVQERKGMLKMWNVWLIALSYGLTVFGTFLTRSGVVQSIHAFASSNVGWAFLTYLGILFAATATLSVYRRGYLKAESSIESLLSREAFFLLNNLVLLSICFATLWGVMFPVLSEAVSGEKHVVSIPFFNAVNVPLFLLLLLLMGIGTLIPWTRCSWKSLGRIFAIPFISSFCFAIILVLAGITRFYPVLAYGLCMFVVLTLLSEISRGLRVQTLSGNGLLSSSTTLLRRHSNRYGGYIIHFGVAVMAAAITSSMAFKVEREFTLAEGEKYSVGAFTLELKKTSQIETENYIAERAEILLWSTRSDAIVGELHPELRQYTRKNENTTEVALREGLLEDVYLVYVGRDETGERSSFKIYINPLQVWLWYGALIILGGVGVILVPLACRNVGTVAQRESPLTAKTVSA